MSGFVVQGCNSDDNDTSGGNSYFFPKKKEKSVSSGINWTQHNLFLTGNQLADNKRLEYFKFKFKYLQIRIF
jgi:hypothetical protein